MSATVSPAPTPTPLNIGHPASIPARAPRSKSQASGGSESRVGAEARRPEPRRALPSASVETVDVETQTDEADDIPIMVDAWEMPSAVDMEGGYHESTPVNTADVAGSSSGSLVGRGLPGSSSFLSSTIGMQAELEMVIRSHMEIVAEHGDRARAASQPLVAPSPPSSGRSAPHGRRHNFLTPLYHNGKSGRGPSVGRGVCDEGSDGECHGEDDEVRSLSLSEDGPVIIRRSVSEGGAALSAGRHGAPAPDPIAMLTDGQKKAARPSSGAGRRSSSKGSPTDEGACDIDRAGLGEFGADIDGEPLGSDRSAPNESDHSAAPTQHHILDPSCQSKCSTGKPENASDALVGDEHALLTNIDANLIPILEKYSHDPAGGTSGSSAARSTWQPANRVRVPALRSSSRSNVHALDLSQISQISNSSLVAGRLPKLGQIPATDNDARPPSARSDLSFGSAHSAFTVLSSPSSSQLASPRPMNTLKATVSMPALHAHHHSKR